MNKLLAITLALSCSAAAAVELPSSVGLHIGSHHTQAREVGTWNDTNPGVFARWDSGLVVGTLRNSESRQSAYAGMTWETPRWHRLAADITVGGITGYGRPVSPLLVVGGSLAVTDSFSIRLSYLPKAAPKGSAAIHLSTEWSFK
jgi:hypothetical protein